MAVYAFRKSTLYFSNADIHNVNLQTAVKLKKKRKEKVLY